MINENRPNLSIIMSVYNGEKTLSKSVNSILAQTYTDYEFIICDDASTDDTWSVLENFKNKDDRIVLIRHTENKGLGASLNDCLKIARGNYIARQDADDISKPERIERTLKYLVDTDCPYAACGVYVFDDEGVFSKRLFEEK